MVKRLRSRPRCSGAAGRTDSGFERSERRGFEDTKAKLEELGVAMSNDFVANAHRAEQAMGDLQLAGQGIEVQFTSGFLPALSNVAEGLAGAGGKGGSAMKELGEKAGAAMKTVIMLFGGTAIGIQELANKAVAVGKVIWDASPLAQGLNYLKTGKVKSLPELWAGLKDDWQAAGDNAQLQISALGDIVADKVQTAGNKIKTAIDSTAIAQAAALQRKAKSALAAAERLAHAQTNVAMAESRATLDIDRETNEEVEKLEKERFSLGLESVTAYYKVRRDLAEATAKEEKDALTAQIDLQQSAMDKEKDSAKKSEIQKQIVELQAKAAVLQIKADGDHNASLLAEQEEREKLGNESLSFEDKILEAQGKRHEMDLAAIKKETNEYRKLLKQKDDPHADAKSDQFQKILTQEADYKQANRELEESERKLGELRHKIQDEAERGAISQAQAKRQVKELDQQWQPVLDKQLATLRAIAKTSGLQPLIDDADEAREKVDDLNASLNNTKDSSAVLEQQFAKSIGHDLHEFLDRGSKDSDTLGKSFPKLALSVASNFASMLQQMMAKKQSSKLGGAGSNGDNDGSGFFSFLSAFQQHDSGGEITHGPSGRDKVPSWLTRGEFVIRERIVAQPGMRHLLNAINQGTSTRRW